MLCNIKPVMHQTVKVILCLTLNIVTYNCIHCTHKIIFNSLCWFKQVPDLKYRLTRCQQFLRLCSKIEGIFRESVENKREKPDTKHSKRQYSTHGWSIYSWWQPNKAEMSGFLVCWAVRRLLTIGHKILCPKSLFNTRESSANTELMLLVTSQSWHSS